MNRWDCIGTLAAGDLCYKFTVWDICQWHGDRSQWHLYQSQGNLFEDIREVGGQVQCIKGISSASISLCPPNCTSQCGNRHCKCYWTQIKSLPWCRGSFSDRTSFHVITQAAGRHYTCQMQVDLPHAAKLEYLHFQEKSWGGPCGGGGAFTSAVEPGCGWTFMGTHWLWLLCNRICRWCCNIISGKFLQTMSDPRQMKALGLGYEEA